VDDDDDLSDIQKTLGHLERPGLPAVGTDQAFNPFKNKGNADQINSSSAQAPESIIPTLGKAEDQLFEQVEFDANFLGPETAEDELMAQYAEAEYEEFGGTGNNGQGKKVHGGAPLRVRTDFTKDLGAQGFDVSKQNVQTDELLATDGNEAGYFDYGRETEDLNDPEFMKRQQEEYEKY
jgi:hypothetical protein